MQTHEKLVDLETGIILLLHYVTAIEISDNNSEAINQEMAAYKIRKVCCTSTCDLGDNYVHRYFKINSNINYIIIIKKIMITFYAHSPY